MDGLQPTRHLIVPLIVSFGIVRGAWLELDAELALGFSRTWIDSGWSDSGTLRVNGTAVEARLEGAVRVQEQLWLTLSAGGLALATGVEGWSKDAAPEVPGTIFSAVQLGLGARWRW